MSEQKNSWTPEEDNILRNIVRRCGTDMWGQVSRLVSQFPGAIKRSAKQCKLRWESHLSHKRKNKDYWSVRQEELLFKLHVELGNQWKVIADHFNERTGKKKSDNDIKNRFYSTLRKKLRKINKLLGGKDSTTKVKKMKPKVLSMIMNEKAIESSSLTEQDLHKLANMILSFDGRQTRELKSSEVQYFNKVIKMIESENVHYARVKNIYGSEQSNRQHVSLRLRTRLARGQKNKLESRQQQQNDKKIQKQHKVKLETPIAPQEPPKIPQQPCNVKTEPMDSLQSLGIGTIEDFVSPNGRPFYQQTLFDSRPIAHPLRNSPLISSAPRSLGGSPIGAFMRSSPFHGFNFPSIMIPSVRNASPSQDYFINSNLNFFNHGNEDFDRIVQEMKRKAYKKE